MNAGQSTFHRPSTIQPGPALVAKIACLMCAWMASSCSWDSMAATVAPAPIKTAAVALADNSGQAGDCAATKGCLGR